MRKTVSVKVTPYVPHDPWVEQRDRERYQALVTALRHIGADERQGLIARALAKIEDDERRKALLDNIKGLPTDGLQRLIG
jgi:hypothetical protein